MFKSGTTLSAVLDLNTLGPAINDPEFMAVAAVTTGPYPSIPTIYDASILVPPTELLMNWADNWRILNTEYPKYLASEDPDDMIVALLATLIRRNVVLYIPPDEFNAFGMLLLNHIYYTYGFTCNFGNTNFAVDESKRGYLVSKFYMLDLMDPDDYTQSYPGNAPLPMFVIKKLEADMHPFNEPVPFEMLVQYFNDLNRAKLKGQIPRQMVTIVERT